MTSCTLPDLNSEATPEGEQTLFPGVRPVTLGDRLALLAAAPIAPRRNPKAVQKPCDLGLFNEAARDQLDMLDLLRTTSGGALHPPNPKE